MPVEQSHSEWQTVMLIAGQAEPVDRLGVLLPVARHSSQAHKRSGRKI